MKTDMKRMLGIGFLVAALGALGQFAVPVQPAQAALFATSSTSMAGLSTATVLVTPAELKNLVASPKTIIAAPGAGKVILPVVALFDYEYGTVAYENGGGGDMYLGLAGPEFPYTGVAYGLPNLVTAAASSLVMYALPAGGPNGPYTQDLRSDFENAALKLRKSTANLTAGDGTLTITLVYQIVDLS